MFSKKFPTPFGLLGDEAKLAFRSKPSGISKLATIRNISETDSYWDEYVTLFDTPSDAFSLISPNDIRRALAEAPENVSTLVRVITSRLFNLISDHTFPSTATSVTSYASSFIRSTTGMAERNTTKEVLNCLRVLQRVFPVIFEVEAESNTLELDLLWRKPDAPPELSRDTPESPQFIIEDEDEDEPEGSRPASTSNNQSPQAGPSQAPAADVKKLPSLSERLFSSLIDLMFCCGFTIPTSLQVDHHKIQYVIWEKGIGSTTDAGPGREYDSNKTEVLRLLLILFSRQIYVSSASLFSHPSFYTLHFVQKTSRRDILTVLCSLLNTALNSHPQSGMAAIGTMAGKLPYNHLVFKGEDARTTLVGTCLQLLCVLLDFQSGTARDKVTGSDDSQSSAPTSKTNAFRYFLAKLHRTQDFAFIINGIVGILEEQMTSMNNLLPGARRSIPYVVDTVILLWKMIELNKKFRLYLLDSDKAMDIVAYLLCYGLEIKDKPHQHGLCRALSYIIQTLSAEPSFGMKLSSPVKATVPSKWHTGGTSADFMINAIYSMVATTQGTLNSLYPALIIALSNCAPYFKNLSINASTRLLQMFTSFSNPLFLLSDEGHPRLLFFMLEIFNSIILHHLQESPHLIYAVLTSHKSFEDLGTFTLSRGLREIRRVQMAREEQAKKNATDKGKAKGNAHGEEEAHEEKARLLESESAASANLSQLEEGLSSANISSDERTADSPASPPGTPAQNRDSGGFISEKARGKQRATRRSMSVDASDSIENLQRFTAAGIGRNGFVPTQEWVTSWHRGLPLDPVMLVITELSPKVQELRHRPSPTIAINDFLASASLEHVLPPVLPLNPRRFLWSDASIIWLTSLIWGEVYVRGMTPLGIWNGTNVRLFYVKHTQTQQPQITQAVSNVVGGLGGLLGRSDSSMSVSRRNERT